MGGSSREALLGGLSSIVLVALFSHYTPNPYPHRLQGMAKEKGHAIKGGTFSGTITAILINPADETPQAAKRRRFVG